MISLVTGLSESKFYSPDYDLTIGVNNCPFPVDHLICADHPRVFDIQKKKIIINHSAKLYTCVSDWSVYRQIEKINLVGSRGSVIDLKYKNGYCHSITSPYIAIVHAYLQGATEIHIAGVDIIGHKHLGKPDNIKIIRNHFTNLNNELIKLNVKLFLIRSTENGILNDIIPKKNGHQYCMASVF
jgi:hypothetical protein